mgnify:CR=1 FL=1
MESLDFDEFMKRQVMPKQFWKINPELLKVRESVVNPIVQKTQTMTKEQKELLEMKFWLEKMNRKLKKDKKASSMIKRKFHLKEKDKAKTM